MNARFAVYDTLHMLSSFWHDWQLNLSILKTDQTWKHLTTVVGHQSLLCSE